MRKRMLLLLLVSTVMADDLWSLTRRGKEHYSRGEYESALELFDSAAVVDPGSQEAHFNRALTLAQLGRIGDAKKILSGVTFTDSVKLAEQSFTEGKIADLEGDLALQKQDIASAKKAYTESLQKYVEALSADSSCIDALRNVELAAGKLARLPEPPEDQQDQNKDQNKDQQDDKNKDDQNKDQQDDQKDQDNDKNQDDQNKDQNDDEQNEDQNDQQDDQQDQNEDDQENQDDQKDQDKNEDQQDDQKDQQDQGEDEQPQPENQQQDSAALNAMQLLEKYADDANDLNKPPKKKAKPISGGKDW